MSFISAKTTGAAYSVCAGSMSIRSILFKVSTFQILSSSVPHDTATNGRVADCQGVVQYGVLRCLYNQDAYPII